MLLILFSVCSNCYESLVLRVTIEEFTPQGRNQFVRIVIIKHIDLHVCSAGNSLLDFYSFNSNIAESIVIIMIIISNVYTG